MKRMFGMAIAIALSFSLTACLNSTPSSFPRPTGEPRDGSGSIPGGTSPLPTPPSPPSPNPMPSPNPSGQPSIPSPGDPSNSSTPQPPTSPVPAPPGSQQGNRGDRSTSPIPSRPGIPGPNGPQGEYDSGQERGTDGDSDVAQRSRARNPVASPIPNLPDTANPSGIPSQNPNSGSPTQESRGLPSENDESEILDEDDVSGESAGDRPSSGPQDTANSDPGPGIMDDENQDSEWDVSNQLPEIEKSRSASNAEEQQIPTVDSSGAPQDDELDQTLNDIDGEILSDREEERAKNDESAVGILADVAPEYREGDAQTGEGEQETVGGTSTEEIPGDHEPRKSTGAGDDDPEPFMPTYEEDDGPDAKDDDVIARQLREAAMAETDPDLKEKLWEEYRRYKARFK